MPRWLWFAPLGGLVLGLGLLGYRQGLVMSNMTETDVIETYTAYYVKTHGGAARATDCTARPGARRDVWIVVSCLAPEGQRLDYPVDRLGRLIGVDPRDEEMHAPKT